MPTYSKVPDFVEDVLKGVHNLPTHSIRIALSNTAPASEASNPLTSGNGVLANVTQIAYTNYSDDMTTDRTLEGVTVVESGGTATVDATDVTITASGGALATWQYVYVYNDTATAPADALIAVIDNEAAVSLADGESITITWDASGLLTLA